MTTSFKFSMLNETFPVIFKHRDWSVFTNVISEVYQRNRNVTWFFGSMYFLDTKWIGTNWKLFNRKQKRWFLFDSWKWSIRKLFSVPTKILPFLSLVLGNRRWYFLLFESSIFVWGRHWSSHQVMTAPVTFQKNVQYLI